MFSGVWVDFNLPKMASLMSRTELIFSNIVTKLFIVHRCGPFYEGKPDSEVALRRKNTNNSSIKPFHTRHNTTQHNTSHKHAPVLYTTAFQRVLTVSTDGGSNIQYKDTLFRSRSHLAWDCLLNVPLGAALFSRNSPSSQAVYDIKFIDMCEARKITEI